MYMCSLYVCMCVCVCVCVCMCVCMYVCMLYFAILKIKEKKRSNYNICQYTKINGQNARNLFKTPPV